MLTSGRRVEVEGVAVNVDDDDGTPTALSSDRELKWCTVAGNTQQIVSVKTIENGNEYLLNGTIRRMNQNWKRKGARI